MIGFGLPLAIYLLVLATINRSSRAIMIPGTWDFAGVLLGAFGFLAFGGPAILHGLDKRLLDLVIRGGNAPDFGGNRTTVVRAAFAAYYLILVAGTVWLIRRHRNVTSIYNVNPDTFGSVLGEVLTRKQIDYVQHGNVLYLRMNRDNPIEEVAPRVEQTTLEVDPSMRFQHVTLRWFPAEGTLRQDVENEIGRELGELASSSNPVGDWLLIVSGFLFLALLLGVATLILMMKFSQ